VRVWIILKEDAAFGLPGGDVERVLIVEDEPQIRFLLSTLIERLGCQPLVATDAVEARQLLSEPPRLMLVDVGLPGESGPELIRSLMAANAIPMTQVVMLTAQPDEVKPLQQDFPEVEVVAKPFRLNKIHGIIKKYVGLSGG